ncbi:MAG: DUF3638 domain-containing protein [Legionellales bacterium]|nr:DUF3638 domain-containing protein [Legionellales bacterium]
MPIKMTERLFVHINNDAFLKGSKLQGEQFGTTITYLKEHVADVVRSGGAISEEIQQLLRSCTELVDYERGVANSKNAKHLDKVADAIIKRTLFLKKGEAVLVPGGWMDDKGGHAMIYQITKDAEGNTLFRIHNAGEGIQYHAKRDEKDKLTYNPVLTYKIPKEKMDPRNFRLIMKKAMEARILNAPKRQPMSAKFLYEGVFPLLEGHLGAEVCIDPHETYRAFTAGQMSGTCAERSLHQMMKSSFAEKDDYRRFIYHFKARSLEDYWHVLHQEDGLQQSKLRAPVEKAIRHQLRLLNLKKTKEPVSSPPEELFSYKEKARETRKLVGYLEELRRFALESLPARRVRGPENALDTRRQLRFVQPLPVRLPDVSAYKRDDAEPVLPIAGGKDLLSNMDKLIAQCAAWRGKAQFQTLFEHLEAFITHLPVTTPLTAGLLPYYSEITTDAKFLEFIQKLNKIQSEYFLSVDALAGASSVLPRQLVAKVGLIAVTAHVNANRPIVATGNAYCTYVSGLYSQINDDSVYMATHDPMLDERWKEVSLACRSLPRKGSVFQYDPSEELIGYYLRIIDSEDALKKQLEALYQKKYSPYFEETALFRDFYGRMQRVRTERALELKNVNNHHCEAMYYFCRNMEELRQDATFAPLLLKFDLQRALEAQYSGSTCRLESHPEPDVRTSWLEFTIKEDGPKIVSTMRQTIAAIHISNALMSSKYGIQKSVAANAIQLVHPKKEISDNNIQLIPNRFAHLSVVLRDSPETRVWGGNWDVGNYVFGVQDLEDRELYHLRQSKHTQIPLTLDYFHRHLEKLNQPALQVYIEANLFQPGLLKTQLLDNAPDFFKLLDGFIENGLDFNQKNTQFTADALFFIRLGTLVYQYAAKLDPARFDARLQAFHHQLNVHIATQKDPAILTSLHFYRFQSLLSQQGMDDADELTDALKSHFHLQVHAQGKRKLDTDSAFHYHELKHQFVRKLKTKDEHISNFMVLNLLSSLGVTLDANSAPKVTKAYPLYTVTDGKESYILNLETGLLFQGEMAYATTPLEILTHRVTKSFGLQNKVLCFTSVDQKVFLVEKPPVSLRFIREGEGFRVQKKWADPLSPAVESWYELTPRTKLQSQYWQVGFLNLSSDAPSGAITGVGPHPIYFVDGPLPLLFDERESTIWRSVDDQTFLVADANLKVTCRGDVNTGCLVNFPEGDRRGQLCQDQSWIHQRLSHFEDPAFIMVWALNPEEYLVDLPRIGMRMKVQRTRPGEPFDFIYEQDGVSYTYDQEAPPLGEGVAQLTFRHDTQTFCVLAIQPFIHSLTRSNTTEYGHLKQDISRRIPPHLMKRALSWQYSGSEHVMRVKMENGEPLPSNTEQALYLTYVYLCSNQPEKAWAMLEACLVRLGGLEGTYAELKYLHWIVEYMPYPLMDDDKENEDAIVVNPQNVACKLKALALLSQFSRRTDKKIVSPALSAPEDTDNGRYEQLFINSTQDFYSSYQTKIYKLFTQLQGLRRELPASFTLKDAETKSLLDDYHGKQPFKSVEPGALGYERVQLHLNILRQEWADLRAKVQTLAAAGKPPDRYANQRLEVIETFIKNYEDITRTTSRLRYVSHYFPFSGLPLKLEAFSDKFQKELNDPRFNLFDKPLHPETHQDLVASLSLETTDVMMLSQFNELLSIAFTVNHPSKQALLTFCRAVLIADRKIILGKETENMPMLCNLLARIACYTETAEADVLDRGTLKSDAGDEVEIRFNHQIQMNERIKLPQSTMNALWKVNLYAHRLPNLEPVAIPALFDDTVSVMESTSNLWEKTPTRPVLIRPEVSTTQTKPRVREWLSDAWVKRRDAWLVLETAFQSAEGVALPLDVDTKGFSREEYQAGCTKYNSLKALQAFASQELSDPERLDDIEKISEMKGSQLTETQEALEKDILALGNLGPDDPVLKQAWVGDIHSGKRAALDIHGLLTLYFHADQSRYAEETGLSSQKINELHALLVQYLAEGIQLQQCTRVTAQVTALKKATTDEDKQRLSYVLAQALFSMNRVDVVKDPTLSLFQFYEDKLLRAQQQEVLDRFLNKEGDLFDESIEKIIMGGGKSKVILPALAQKKADGTHLILIEVPRALLRTNYVDLKATSSSLFHQDAYLFEFNRDSTCTAFRLEQLFHELTDVMVNKRYVVTTGDALQSLELKYIELLNEKPKTSDVLGHLEWKNRVLWAERLVSLVKHRGDVIIDEVHQGLLLKTQLNYTIGEPTPLPPFVIQHAIEMYRFFKQVDIGAYFKPVKPGAYTLEAAIASRDEFTEPLNMKNIMQALVRQLISHGDSPLKALILDWRVLEREDVKSELTAYLLGESTAVPGFIRKGTLEMKQQIAFYKEQISNMLPFTLKRHQGEHFGPSKKVSSPMDRLRAIPYSANNVPNEQSRFGNTLETIDYTIQSLLITGVDANVVRILVKDWVAEGYHEARVLHCKSFDDTPMAERFRQLVQGRLPLQLSELNPDDEGQIQQIAQVLGREPSLIYAVLNDHVLPTIKTNDTILHSNAYSHVDLLRTCQSMSGTPWNRSTFHQRLHYSEASGRGTDGYVVRAIEEKKPFIRGIDFDKPKTFIESLLAPSEQPTTARAIIDISASFKGVSNITVAADLARYIHAHPSQFSDPEPLKFVLFFNEGVLSALKVQDKIEGQMPVVIGSSDPDNITDKLGGCSPYGRFTYYDQEHTVGTDVKQGD